MSNMSYCRFRNTLSDLQDCADNIGSVLSSDEHSARQRLIVLCQQIVDECCDREGDLHPEYTGECEVLVENEEDEE